jgi:hypothetical protein
LDSDDRHLLAHALRHNQLLQHVCVAGTYRMALAIPHLIQVISTDDSQLMLERLLTILAHSMTPITNSDNEDEARGNFVLHVRTALLKVKNGATTAAAQYHRCGIMPLPATCYRRRICDAAQYQALQFRHALLSVLLHFCDFCVALEFWMRHTSHDANRSSTLSFCVMMMMCRRPARPYCNFVDSTVELFLSPGSSDIAAISTPIPFDFLPPFSRLSNCFLASAPLPLLCFCPPPF